MAKKDLRGQKFGKWTVIKIAGRYRGNITWLCRCECGKESVVKGSTLRAGTSKGCLDCHNRELSNMESYKVARIFGRVISLTKCLIKYGVNIQDALELLESERKVLKERKYQIK